MPSAPGVTARTIHERERVDVGQRAAAPSGVKALPMARPSEHSVGRLSPIGWRARLMRGVPRGSLSNTCRSPVEEV